MKKSMISIFESNKCKIRPFEKADMDDFMSYRNDMEWMEHQGFKGLTKEEYEEALLNDVSLEKGMQLAIINKSNDKLIGDLYVKKENDVFWIGYTISPNCARKGYAYDVVSALIDRIREQGEYEIRAGVLAENVASVKLLEKLGFKYLEIEDDELIYSLI